MSRPAQTFERAVAVDPSNTTVLDCEGFYVGDVAGGSDVAIIAKRTGLAVTISGCLPGKFYHVACNKILLTGTTAASIVALY